MKLARMIGCATSLVVTACQQAQGPAPSDGPQPEESTSIELQEQANKALLHKYHVEIWEQGNFSAAGNYLDPSAQFHSVPVLPNNQKPGADFYNKFLGAFSKLQSHEDAILSGGPTGDLVSIQWTITATHTADFFGIAPTNRTIQFSGMDVLRVKNGKFVEQWGGVADQTMKVAALLSAP